MQKILVVDDDRIVLRVIEKHFNQHCEDLELLTAADGCQALTQLSNHEVALIVTDLEMPQMDGYALLSWLSANRPDVPVIILTAYGSPINQRTALEKGAVGFLRKPVQPAELVADVREILSDKQERDGLQSVPLEIFVRLIESQRKTCTLQVSQKSGNRRGTLYFRSGNLLDARLDRLSGDEAARCMLGWMETSFSVESPYPFACSSNDAASNARGA